MSDETSMSSGRRSPREEALEWFGVMHGPEAEDHRPVFEAWLSLSAVNREAYSVISDAFGIGKGMSRDDYGEVGVSGNGAANNTADGSTAPEDDRKPANPSRPRPRYLSGIVIGAVLIGLAGAASFRAGLSLRDGRNSDLSTVASVEPQGDLHYAVLTSIGEIRTFPLGDGSSVTLDTDSLLTVSYSDDKPLLRLERGRARFNVRAGRPFVVTAGSGRMTAQESLFDVSLDASEKVAVHVLRGSAEIAGTGLSGKADSGMDEHLKPGDRAVYSSTQTPIPAASGRRADDNWPSGIREFDTAPLSELISEANRYSTVKLVLADPSLGSLTVSGTFRINDVQKVGDRVADLFDLTVERANPEEIVLRRP